MGIGPGVVVPTIEGTRMIYPVQLGAIWLGLTIVGLAVRGVLPWVSRQLPASITPHLTQQYTTVPTETDDDSAETTIKDVQALYEEERRIGRRYLRYAGRAGIAAPVAEEIIFRGGPYLLALTVAWPLALCLLGGTVLWSLAHRREFGGYHRYALQTLPSGLFYVYLWLIGLWWVAILIHMGNNLVAVGGMLGEEWWRRRQAPFTVGETMTITVDNSAQSNDFGLFQVTGANGATLYVAGVSPGETRHVRIAVSDRGYTEAFPID